VYRSEGITTNWSNSLIASLRAIIKYVRVSALTNKGPFMPNELSAPPRIRLRSRDVLLCVSIGIAATACGSDAGSGDAAGGGMGNASGAGRTGASAGSGTVQAGASSGGASSANTGGASNGASSGASGTGASGAGAAGAATHAGAGGLGGAGGTVATGTGGGAPAGGRGGAGGNGGAGGHGGAGGSIGGGGGIGSGGSSGGGASCSTPAAASTLVGWAAVSGGGVTTTTGGGNATPTTVTTLAQLNSAADGTTAAVIWVKGKITGDIKVGSNKTIAGICGAELHGHVEVNGSANVIIRNIAIVGYGVGNCALDPSYDASVGCSSGADAISVQKNANHIWIDHCDISDGTDGNLDITNAADFVTVSWTKFHYSPRTDTVGSDSTGAAGHRFSNLVGGSDSKTGDAGTLNITWHHDWWADNVVERQPRVRFGKNHLFNDLWTSSASNYCVRAGKEAQILIDDSVFSGVKDPQQFNSTTDQGTSFITATNNVYTNTSGLKDSGGGGTAFTAPPYAYTPDPTAGLAAAIQSGAGPH